MYQSHGWWFPDQDTHFSGMLTKAMSKIGRAEYQHEARELGIHHAQQRRLALDIGANVGLWTRDLAASFDRVIAFEPVSDFRACLEKNVPASNLEVKACALGNQDTTIDMVIVEGNTGHSHVNPNTMGTGSVPMYRLDSLNITGIDLVKIDCEGYEETILQGAQETLCRERPIIIIEQKLHKDTGVTKQTQFNAIALLESWGFVRLGNVRNDYVMGWPRPL